MEDFLARAREETEEGRVLRQGLAPPVAVDPSRGEPLPEGYQIITLLQGFRRVCMFLRTRATTPLRPEVRDALRRRGIRVDIEATVASNA